MIICVESLRDHLGLDVPPLSPIKWRFGDIAAAFSCPGNGGAGLWPGSSRLTVRYDRAQILYAVFPLAYQRGC